MLISNQMPIIEWGFLLIDQKLEIQLSDEYDFFSVLSAKRMK